MKQQRGGTFLGFVLGLVFGLGAALAVAVYVTKVPVPFLNKAQSRTAEQDAAETRKNKDWDPNLPLQGKKPVRSAADGGKVEGADDKTLSTAEPTTADAKAKADAKTDTKTDSKAAKAEGKSDAKPASADPLGDLAKAKAGNTPAEPYTYFVQVGAYRTPEEAETQRAKVSMLGVESKLSEREQNGRMVYRVRVGPFERRDDAEKSKQKLEDAGVETALVRVQR